MVSAHMQIFIINYQAGTHSFQKSRNISSSMIVLHWSCVTRGQRELTEYQEGCELYVRNWTKMLGLESVSLESTANDPHLRQLGSTIERTKYFCAITPTWLLWCCMQPSNNRQNVKNLLFKFPDVCSACPYPRILVWIRANRRKIFFPVKWTKLVSNCCWHHSSTGRGAGGSVQNVMLSSTF